MEEIPRSVLETAVQLREPLKDVYLALYQLGKPSSATEVAEKVGHARAYIHMRLNQLADMGKVGRVEEKGKKGGKKVRFVVIGVAR